MNLIIMPTIYVLLYHEKTLNALELKWPRWINCPVGWSGAENCRSMKKRGKENVWRNRAADVITGTAVKRNCLETVSPMQIS